MTITTFFTQYSKKYRNCVKADNPPHIFAIADNAYHSMMHHKHSQVNKQMKQPTFWQQVYRMEPKQPNPPRPHRPLTHQFSTPKPPSLGQPPTTPGPPPHHPLAEFYVQFLFTFAWAARHSIIKFH